MRASGRSASHALLAAEIWSRASRLDAGHPTVWLPHASKCTGNRTSPCTCTRVEPAASMPTPNQLRPCSTQDLFGILLGSGPRHLLLFFFAARREPSRAHFSSASPRGSQSQICRAHQSAANLLCLGAPPWDPSAASRPLWHLRCGCSAPSPRPRQQWRQQHMQQRRLAAGAARPPCRTCAPRRRQTMSMARPSSRPCSVEQRDARACAADVAGVIWEQKEEKGDSVDACRRTATRYTCYILVTRHSH